MDTHNQLMPVSNRLVASASIDIFYTALTEMFLA